MGYVLPPGPFCCFCECIAGRLPWYLLQETKYAVAYLNPRQRSNGAVLIAPKRHVCVLTALSDAEVDEMFQLASRIAGMVATRLSPEGLHTWCNSGTAAGQSEAHVHFQVVPRYAGVAYTFASSIELPVTPREAMRSIANQLTTRHTDTENNRLTPGDI